jgi:hypothetical protein
VTVLLTERLQELGLDSQHERRLLCSPLSSEYLWVHSAYGMGTGGSIPKGKVARVWHEPFSSILIKVKKGWSYSSATRLRFNM